MYTNDLLEEKYMAQKKLAQQAKKEKKDYLEFIEKEVRELFKKKGWNLKYSKKKGGYSKQKLLHP
jgi:hypothetical protein